jgi:hypothetical protein
VTSKQKQKQDVADVAHLDSEQGAAFFQKMIAIIQERQQVAHLTALKSVRPA